MSDINLFSENYDLNRQKVKVLEKPEIIVHGTKDKPYFEIRYKKVGRDDYIIGYSSYNLNNCFQFLEEEFEIVAPEEKESGDAVTQKTYICNGKKPGCMNSENCFINNPDKGQ